MTIHHSKQVMHTFLYYTMAKGYPAYLVEVAMAIFNRDLMCLIGLISKYGLVKSQLSQWLHPPLTAEYVYTLCGKVKK